MLPKLLFLRSTEPDGQFLSPISKVKIQDSGDVQVTDQFNHRVQKFTADGQFVLKWGSQGSGDGEFDYPYGVVVDKAGYVYVVDQQNNCVQKFTSDGQFVLKWAYTFPNDGYLNHPFGITVDDSGYVYVTDYQNKLQKFTSDGQFCRVPRFLRLTSHVS